MWEINEGMQREGYDNEGACPHADRQRWLDRKSQTLQTDVFCWYLPLLNNVSKWNHIFSCILQYELHIWHIIQSWWTTLAGVRLIWDTPSKYVYFKKRDRWESIKHEEKILCIMWHAWNAMPTCIRKNSDAKWNERPFRHVHLHLLLLAAATLHFHTAVQAN